MKRDAFSLIELLIVILIMGVVYTMAISNFNQLKSKSDNLSIENLKEYLGSFKYLKSVELICFDDCSVCSVYVDSNKTKEVNDFLDADIKVYRYSNSYGYVQKDPKIFFNKDNVQKSVCFSYKLDTDKVGDQVLIEYKNKFYDMSTYFTKPTVYSSIEDAQSVKEDSVNRVMK